MNLNTLDQKASQLGRLLTYFQIAANEDMPALVLEFQIQDIHRLSGELLKDLRAAPPGTHVRVDTELATPVLETLSEYFHGRPDTPDSVPDDWQ